jgi:hypothetical protein
VGTCLAQRKSSVGRAARDTPRSVPCKLPHRSDSSFRLQPPAMAESFAFLPVHQWPNAQVSSQKAWADLSLQWAPVPLRNRNKQSTRAALSRAERRGVIPLPCLFSPAFISIPAHSCTRHKRPGTASVSFRPPWCPPKISLSRANPDGAPLSPYWGCPRMAFLPKRGLRNHLPPKTVLSMRSLSFAVGSKGWRGIPQCVPPTALPRQTHSHRRFYQQERTDGPAQLYRPSRTGRA